MSSAARDAIQIIEKARVIPPVKDVGPFHRRAGVYGPDGNFCDLANIRRGNELQLRPGRIDAEPELKLAGRHLYGGQINAHFGHFLCESLARLWALDRTERPASILLLPRRNIEATDFQSYQTNIFALLGLDIPVTIVRDAMVVEELIVPEQAFGIGDLSDGSPAFRDWIHKNLAPDIAPEGPELLYLSRKELSLRAGGVVNEAAIAENLAREGYEIFAPEMHDITIQIARFRAAKKIIGIEGSALHLYGMVGNADQEAGIVVRRTDIDASETIARQIRAFCGARVEMFSAIRREWDSHGEPIRSSKSLAEADLPHLGRQMAAAGFITDSAWPDSVIDSRKLLDKIKRRIGREYQLIEPGQTAGMTATGDSI